MAIDETGAADILMGDVVRLEDVLSRDSVSSVCYSFFELFGLPVRVISHEGDLLADVHKERTLCRHLNTLDGGAQACSKTVSAVRDVEPTGQCVIHPCFTGAVYRVSALEYQGRPIGRFIIGPYVPAETTQAPDTLLSVDPGVEADKVQDYFARMPRVRKDIAEQLSDHLRKVLELLVFSGHRAQLASTMQVANVRENYRELAEKNEKLKVAYEELKQLDQLKSNFLATVSHELRTPLTSIIGYTEMLDGGAAGTQKQRMTFSELQLGTTYFVSCVQASSSVDAKLVEASPVLSSAPLPTSCAAAGCAGANQSLRSHGVAPHRRDSKVGQPLTSRSRRKTYSPSHPASHAASAGACLVITVAAREQDAVRCRASVGGCVHPER